MFIPAGFVLLGSLAFAQSEQEPALLSDPPDGSEAAAPEVRAVFAPAEVLETTVTRQGGRDIIVQHLALDPNDPIKPVFSPPLADILVKVPEESAPVEVSAAPPSIFLMLSATVYPGSRTYLNWTHFSADGASRDFSGWSNIDFNHFDSINEILGTDGNQHTFILGVGTESEIDAAHQPPPFASEAPAFVPDGEIPADALVVLDSLHRIYATEAEMLAEAYAGREAARLVEEAEAEEELANPPPPKDLIIRYRIAETPLPTPAEGDAQ